MNRELKKKIAAAIVLVALLALFLVKSSAMPWNQQKSYEQTFMAMDTIMTITAYSDKEETAEEACVAAVQEVNRLDKLLSTGDADSEVSRINANGGGTLSEDTSVLLKDALSLYQSTDGAFDITIYPVTRAWGFTDENYRVPSETELAGLLENVDASKIEFDETAETISLPEGVEIDFGGIAKGYTSAKVIEVLHSYGIESACANLGGNVQVLGEKPDGSDWKIAIQDPDDSEKYLGAVQISDGQTVITSGGYERKFEENGQIYHHIIDPSTGYPAYNGLTSVSIICTDAALADGLSTSLFVMGTDRAIAYYKAHADEFDCVLYTDDGTLYVSKGIADKFESDLSYQVVE